MNGKWGRKLITRAHRKCEERMGAEERNHAKNGTEFMERLEDLVYCLAFLLPGAALESLL